MFEQYNTSITTGGSNYKAPLQRKQQHSNKPRAAGHKTRSYGYPTSAQGVKLDVIQYFEPLLSASMQADSDDLHALLKL